MSTPATIKREASGFFSAIRPIMLVNGLLLTTLGAAMLLPAIVDLIAENKDWQVFASASMVTMLIGVGLYGGARGTVTEMTTRQAFVMVTLAWVLLSLFGALP
jgi:trk system potassium uptake protein TrkH